MKAYPPPFHLAFPVRDLAATRRFYQGLLGCRVGREDAQWIDFDFFGHQITAHLAPEVFKAPTNPVDGDAVPAHHFGAVLPWEAWRILADKLQRVAAEFLIQPKIRFEGEVGEQATLFILDPCGNALEFKSFRDPEQLFARPTEEKPVGQDKES